MIVTLKWSEVLIAAQAGVQRRVLHLRRQTGAPYGHPGEPWDVDIEGCAAELAVAQVLGTYWTGMEANGSDRRAQVGDAGTVQVRSTRHPGGCLILHNEDADDDVFVLVVGRIPQLDVKGWIHGRNGKRADYWRSQSVRHPAFFVPQQALAPIGRLASMGEGSGLGTGSTLRDRPAARQEAA